MLKKLGDKWGIRGWQFFWVLCTFAVTGTFTAWVGKNITQWFSADKFSLLWWILKISVFVIGYQLFILFFGFCFGQFAFFWHFEKKLLSRLGILKKTQLVRLAILASGNGSNAIKIIEYFKDSSNVCVKLIVSNNPTAGVLEIAKAKEIESYVTAKNDTGGDLLSLLQNKKVDFLILAGYLKKVPPAIINAFPKKIINLHPALLPSYGGKGMYGLKVHEAVIANREKETGITIHYADDQYDHGEIIFQKKCAVNSEDNPATLAQKVQVLEHRHYPEVIESVIKKRNAR